MKKFPKISIVTAVYNGADFIEQTIKSVLEQNYPNLEYIIVDGGSTDGTTEIIRKYSDKLAWWVSEKDDGLYSAVQKGFEHSTGEIMAWINSDDYYSKHCFKTVAEIFSENSKIEWLTGFSIHYDEKDRIIDAWRSRDFTRLDFLMGDYKYVQQESTFWRRTLWEKAGGRLAKYRLAGDFELWLRFSRYAQLYCVNSYFAGFRVRSKNQLSLDGRNEYLAEAADAIAKEKPSEMEKKAIKKIKFWRGIEKIIAKTKIFNKNIPNRFIRKIYEKMYSNRRIAFDRLEQKFII